MSAPRQAPGRSPLLAVVLSGLGPGAGHSYVGRPFRGAVLVGLLIAACLAWTAAVPHSYDAARLLALPPLLLLLAILVDSGRLAARAPRPLSLAPWQRWPTHAAVVVVTGFVLPAGLAAALEAQASLVVAPDSSLEPRVVEGDMLVVARRADLGSVSRGDVVVIEREGEPPVLKRVVGLPGESVAVRRGVVEVAGVAWPEDADRPWRGHDLSVAPTPVPAQELAVLSDQRRRDEAAEWLVPAGRILGRASWVLWPADWDALRIGVSP